MDPDSTELPWRSGNTHGFCVTGGAPADCFGANPVASALGNPTRRDPGGAMRTYHEGRPAALNTGTFYFGGNRNFLLWSDRTVRSRIHAGATQKRVRL